jgi:ketosteroid isomerase-like protein
MTSHPNFDRAQATLDAARQGDYAPAFDAFADDVLVENGPGAGPWHRPAAKTTWRCCCRSSRRLWATDSTKTARCVYADDRVAISLIHETGTAPGGDPFDNLAVYISCLRPDEQTDRLRTVDLDAEHGEAFWAKNPGTASKDFS